jgi:hypothetical protein
MATFAAIKNNIESDLNRTDLTTSVNKYINEAINYYSNEKFWFTAGRTTFTTTPSQKPYGDADGVPNFSSIINFKITVNGSDNPVIPRPFSWIDNVDISSFEGDPLYYGLLENSADQRVWLYPVPDATYTCTVTYRKTYADLSASADTNDFTDKAQFLIEARTKKNMYLEVIHNEERAALMNMKEQEQYLILKTRTDHMDDGEADILPRDF